MPRRPFGQRDPTVRADALKRHALVRRLERREKWLEKAGVTPQLLAEAVETLQAGMRATKLIPAVVDKRGTILERDKQWMWLPKSEIRRITEVPTAKVRSSQARKSPETSQSGK